MRYVNDDRAALLGKLGMKTAFDVLCGLPHRYLDFSRVDTVASAAVGVQATLVVTVDAVELKRPRPRMTVVEVSCYDDTGVVVASFFGQPWLARQFCSGQRLVLSGKIGFSYGFKRMNGPFHDIVGDACDAAAPRVRMLPVHRVTEGLSQQWMRRIVSCALEDGGDVCDFWPARLRVRRAMMPLGRALRAVHFPVDARQAEEARRRLAYDEAALLHVALAARRDVRPPGVVPVSHRINGPHMGRLRSCLPFPLTSEQEAAVADILGDMAAPAPMSRLLLGDVGTGKTAVATVALCAVADTGTQAALMAPTGVLAEQYAEKVGPLLDAAGVTWGLLTGATPSGRRRDLLACLRAGRVDVLFGTHAILEDAVSFSHLSLVVVDEQQRFGVAQRHALREKGRGADLLVMTATPIPRTLALSIYGDLELSYLRSRPVPGAGVTTEVVSRRNRADAYQAIARALDEGRQAYVVCPLVGTSAVADSDGGRLADRAADSLAAGEDPSDPKAAEREAEVLQRQVFRDRTVGLLTGRMKPAEKAHVMADFKDGKIDVLVSTTVVEVGVDVPNATVMMIEDADRFGLAQLHQLRGRVGRGAHPGRAFLVSDAKGPAAKARLEALVRLEDGFALAEEDLRLRREGDILGMRQSGEAELKFVDLARDEGLVSAARDDMRALMKDDPLLEHVENRPIRAEVIARYGDVFREVGGG